MTTQAPGFLDDLLPIRRITVNGVATPFVRDVDFDSETMSVAVDATAGKVSIGVKPEAVSRLVAWKDPVRAVWDAPLEVGGNGPFDGVEVDGVELATGDRVAVIGATDPEDNGIYAFTVGINDLDHSFQRAEDFDDAENMKPGSTFTVLEGDVYAGATFRLASPTTGEIEPGEAELRFERVDPKNGIPASGDVTGETDRVRIQAILDRGLSVQLVADAVYYVDEPIEVPSNTSIRCCCGVATIKPVYESELDPDDRENAVILVDGQVTGTVNTTLSGDAKAGTMSLTVAASQSASIAGTYLLIEGRNPQYDLASDSSANPTSEIVEVASGFAGGTSVALRRKTVWHHNGDSNVDPDYGPHTVRSVVPCLNVVIEGILVDCTDNATIAAALLIRNAIGTKVANFGFKHVSRAGVITYTAHEVRGREIVNHGSSNGTVLLETSHGCHFTEVYRTSEGTRTHESGFPIGEITMRWHCTSCIVDGGHFEHGCLGIRHRGGNGNITCDLTFTDFDMTEVSTRDPELDEGQTIGFVDCGASVLGNDEFGYAIQVRGISAHNIRGANKFGAGAIFVFLYAHDLFWSDFSGITLSNIQDDPTDAGPPLNGILCSDFSGSMTNINLRGIGVGFITNNVFTSVNVDNLFLVSGSGYNTDNEGGPAFLFNHLATGVVQGISPHFGTVRIDGWGHDPPSPATSAPFRFGSAWTAAGGDRSLKFDTVYVDGRRYCDVHPHLLQGFTFGSPQGPYQGQVGTIVASGSQPPDVVVGTAPANNQVVFCAFPDPSTNWGMVAYGEATINVVGTPKVGEVFVCGSSGYAETGAIPSYPLTYFRVTGLQAGGWVNVQPRP